ncbi:MAG TPA: RES family NAD+ phosphorylase [Candidatus Polarisedimenticolaceae bacterium]
MSSDIWTRCAGSSEIRGISGRARRAVEAQHVVSTAKLTDTLGEQAVLERLIESAKPALPRDRAFGGRHFLLTTSFRYPPLRHGSRFATRAERSLWYGAHELRTVFAEVAYYRLVFLEGTHAPLESLETELSVFSVPYRTRKGVDLTRAPFDAHRAAIASKGDYRASQALGAAMRAAGVEAFRFPSARDPEGGTGFAAFSPSAFAAGPSETRTWWCRASREGVLFLRKDAFSRESLTFSRSSFLQSGRLPQPAP